MFDSSQVTCLIPTSPIPRHPSTDLIEGTIRSLKYQLPDARIIVMFDGVRPNVEHRRNQYSAYIDKLVYGGILSDWGITPRDIYSFSLYTQQAEMTKRALRDLEINTPYVLFCEHDGELVTTHNPRDGVKETLPEDCVINWKDITDLLASGGSNLVRFYAWEKIYWEHEHLMCGQIIQGDSKFIKTRQYSQWPHIARTDFYKWMLDKYTRPGELKMIELAMHGPVSESPWEDFRVSIYYPEPNARRFYHRNGRADENGQQDPVDW